MSFEWDPSKARQNERKHGVLFADAVSVLDDERAITMNENADGEQRSITIGTDLLGRILVVVYTWRTDRIRMISARKATPNERRQYLEGE